MKKDGRLKEKNYQMYLTADVRVLQRNILLEQARHLHIEGIETLSMRGISRELALATYREE